VWSERYAGEVTIDENAASCCCGFWIFVIVPPTNPASPFGLGAEAAGGAGAADSAVPLPPAAAMEVDGGG